MIDTNNVPSNVIKLALGCFIGEHIGPDQLLEMPRENAIAVAANCGLSLLEYASALRWISEYQARHADALEQYAHSRASGN